MILTINNGFSVSAYDKYNKSMDICDVIVSAYYHAGDISRRLSNDEVLTVKKYQALSDLNGDTVAFYIRFSSGVYAVINNDVNNPTAIEFGEGCNHLIELNMKENPHSRILYFNPLNVYNENEINTIQKSNVNAQVKDFHDYYPSISTQDPKLAGEIKRIKEQLVSEGKVGGAKGDGDYGFINVSNMPSGNYTSDTIIYATSTDWAIMSDYDSIASDHCGATTVTNLALYWPKRGYTNLKVQNSKYQTFVAVHAIVGNGPVSAIAGHTVTYFSNRGYTASYSTANSTTNYKSAILYNRPCGILLSDAILSWHWIVGVGWREYTASGNFYYRINNNWDNHVNVYYMRDVGSTLWACKQYWVSN